MRAFLRAFVTGLLGIASQAIVWIPGSIATPLGAKVGSVAAVDVALAAGSLGFLAGSLVVGRTPRRRMRGIAVAMIGAGAAGQLWAASTSSPIALAIGFALANVGGAATWLLQAELLRRAPDERGRARASGVFVAVSACGLAGLQLLAPRVAASWGVSWALLPAVPLLLAAGALVWRWGGEAARPTVDQGRGAAHGPPGRVGAMPLLLACGVLAAASVQHNPLLNGVDRAFVAGGLPPSSTAHALALATVAGALLTGVLTHLPARHGDKRTPARHGLLAGMALAALAYFVPGLVGNVLWVSVFAATAVLRGGTMTILALAPALAAGDGNERRAVGYGNVAKALGGAGANAALALLGTVEERVLGGRVASLVLIGVVVAALVVERRRWRGGTEAA